MTHKFKTCDRLRVTDTSISGDFFKLGQEFVVNRCYETSDGTPLVELVGHEGDGWTEDQFEKVEVPWEAPTFETNTPRLGETPEQTEARTAPRDSGKHITTDPKVRAFSSGATRDLDTDKLDYEGFLSPLVLQRYAEHMHKARKMPNGDMRASDNWQLGIPLDVYMKSMWRHFKDVWSTHRGYDDATDIESELCALLFNVNGYLHEHLKAKREAATL